MVRRMLLFRHGNKESPAEAVSKGYQKSTGLFKYPIAVIEFVGCSVLSRLKRLS